MADKIDYRDHASLPDFIGKKKTDIHRMAVGETKEYRFPKPIVDYAYWGKRLGMKFACRKTKTGCVLTRIE